METSLLKLLDYKTRNTILANHIVLDIPESACEVLLLTWLHVLYSASWDDR